MMWRSFLAFLLAGCAATTEPAAPSGSRETVVVSVTDGDTIVVEGGTRVRLIGIDTPEMRMGAECHGAEATAAMEQLLPVGERVRLVHDVERTDRFGRTLAYVHRVRDELFVNVELLDQGVAQVSTFPPNVAHVDEFLATQQAAREAGRGLWGGCPGVTPEPTPEPTPSPMTSGGGCDPAYPDVCVPPPPPDLGCSDIPATHFRALPPDPHELDGNDDGVACEVS
jgi:micrococcal nuclease